MTDLISSKDEKKDNVPDIMLPDQENKPYVTDNIQNI